MDDRDPTSGRNAKAILASAIAVVVLLCLYVLSIRPVCWLMLHGYIPDHVYAAIYSPLFWLGERWEPFGDFLVQYLVNL